MLTIRQNPPVPSTNPPLHDPRNSLNKPSLNHAAPPLTDSLVHRHISRHTADALFPRPRGTRRPPLLPAATTPFSLAGNTLSLVLPVPPSINKQYATVNGRRVLAAAGRHYKRTVGQLLMVNAASSSSAWHGFLREAQERALTLTIHCYFSTLLRRDLDGGIKITQDALCEAMNINDNRIMEIHLYKTLDKNHPRLECALALTTGLRPSRRTAPAGHRSGRQRPR